MNARIALATITLTMASFASLAAPAATPPAGAPSKASASAPARASTTNHARRHYALQQHATHRLHASMDRLHLRVAAARDAEQQRWIAQGLRDGRLSVPQAAALERTQARIDLQQARLARQGHESVDQALAMQHLQDVQDWAIRTGHTDVALQVGAA